MNLGILLIVKSDMQLRLLSIDMEVLVNWKWLWSNLLDSRLFQSKEIKTSVSSFSLVCSVSSFSPVQTDHMHRNGQKWQKRMVKGKFEGPTPPMFWKTQLASTDRLKHIWPPEALLLATLLNQSMFETENCSAKHKESWIQHVHCNTGMKDAEFAQRLRQRRAIQYFPSNLLLIQIPKCWLAQSTSLPLMLGDKSWGS